MRVKSQKYSELDIGGRETCRFTRGTRLTFIWDLCSSICSIYVHVNICTEHS